MANPVVAVNARAARNLRHGGVWVYRSDLDKPDAATPRAAVVEAVDLRGRRLATALSSSSSQIALRVISREPLEQGLPTLIESRLLAATEYRKRFVQDSEAYRLVFSEADGLPGLIIDRYAHVFVLQALTQAMDREDVGACTLEFLKRQFGDEISVVERVEPKIRRLEDLPARENQLLFGSQSATEYRMNGLRFQLEALQGQKTGAFLDQRENYAAAAQYAHGEALDVFCYQGGFSLHLGRICTRVTGVDISRPALEVAEQNEIANREQLRCDEIEWIEANAFELMKDYAAAGRRYDTIVIDPPAFAKSKRAINSALRGYKELNLRGLKMLRPGGTLVTCSCSHHVSPQEFQQMLAEAAADAGREVVVLETRGQAKDHPVLATVPETAYLKCVIAYVR
jgi:23S rRNA (cytosine1962-C5)-methyltransferase